MCIYSVITDNVFDDWNKRWLDKISNPLIPNVTPPLPFPTQEELKAFYELLEKAKEYDKITNQPDCELDEKKEKVKELAHKLGVEVVFP